MSRIVDRGAIVAAYVGIGMAVTMAIGFLLVIPIQPIYLLLSFPGGMVIGYYANARAGRQRGAWRWILPNSLLAGVVTGLTLAILLLGTRALFFFADSGYPDFNRTDQSGAPAGPTCHLGTASCFSEEAAPGLGWLGQLSRIVRERAESGESGSYTARLLAEGPQRIAQKIGEEGVELALAGAGGEKDQCIEEAADLLYHLAVLMQARDFGWDEVAQTLRRRHEVR